MPKQPIQEYPQPQEYPQQEYPQPIQEYPPQEYPQIPWEEDEEEEQVVITMDNFNASLSSYQLLQKSFGNNCKNQEKPFSYTFQNLKQVLTIDRNGLGLPEINYDEVEEEEEEEPLDEQGTLTEEQREEMMSREPIEGGMPDCVTVSYQFKCIIIGASSQLIFLDMFTKKFIKGLRTKSGGIRCVVIEKDGHRGGEAVIISFAHHVIEKYDLESLMKNEEIQLNVKPLWTSGTKKSGDSGRGFTNDVDYNWPEHLVICYSDKYDSFRNLETDEKKLGNIMFVCDKWNNRIKILNTFDGKQLGFFGVKGNSKELGPNIEFREPWGITIDNNDRILVGQFAGHHIKRLENQNGQMVVENCFGGTSVMYNPFGIFYDKLTNRLLIPDGECKILILDFDSGKFIEPVFNETFQCPSHVCINYETGELYITDLYTEKLYIYE